MGILSSVMKKAELKFVKSINCIRAQCRRAGIEMKLAYDIRRTVASEMDRRGIKREIFSAILDRMISTLSVPAY